MTSSSRSGGRNRRQEEIDAAVAIELAAAQAKMRRMEARRDEQERQRTLVQFEHDLLGCYKEITSTESFRKYFDGQRYYSERAGEPVKVVGFSDTAPERRRRREDK
jgi:hypothetical protein